MLYNKSLDNVYRAPLYSLKSRSKNGAAGYETVTRSFSQQQRQQQQQQNWREHVALGTLHTNNLYSHINIKNGPIIQKNIFYINISSPSHHTATRL